jgi:septal ring factor EnvC (AmiA/AmiB activator)
LCLLLQNSNLKCAASALLSRAMSTLSILVNETLYCAAVAHMVAPLDIVGIHSRVTHPRLNSIHPPSQQLAGSTELHPVSFAYHPQVSRAHRLKSELQDAKGELLKAQRQIAALEATNQGLRCENAQLSAQLIALERRPPGDLCRPAAVLGQLAAGSPICWP